MANTFMAFSRDHSASMSSITGAAKSDYNATLDAVKQGAALDATSGNSVRLSTVLCGWSNYDNEFRAAGNSYHPSVRVEHDNVEIAHVKALSTYPAPGSSTPLVDSVMACIDLINKNAHEATNKYIVMVTTDGGENSSRHTSTALATLMNRLTATGQWTFIARVPRGGTRQAKQLGFPEGNILEWDTTARGQAQAQATTTSAMANFMSSGQQSTGKFFANLEDVSIADVKAALVDISNDIQWLTVDPADAGRLIRDFVEDKTKSPLLKGAVFYKLVKTEPKVQANKRIIIRDKTSGAVYEGAAARQMLALPTAGTVRLAPDELGNFEVYIQSTSVNRKVDAGTRVLYYTAVGVKFKEGPSSK